MTDPDVITIDNQIDALRKRLQALKRARQKMQRAAKPKSDRPQGRPPIPKEKIEMAKELAKDHTLRDVALVTGISRTTLYENGITRYRLDAQKASERERAALLSS